jgi:hypothetical protein
VKRLRQVISLNRASDYKWRAGAETRAARQAADAALAKQIREVHADFGGAYGSPRITAELRVHPSHRIDVSYVTCPGRWTTGTPHS